MSNLKLTNITKELIKEIKTEITFSLIPKTIKIVQEEFIKSIPNNDYFTSGEKQALALYFKSYSTFHSKNVMLFESKVDEGVADWFKSGWEKIKSTFGGIKNYVVEIWTKIKKFFIDLISKGKDVVKGMVDKAKGKIKSGFEKAINGPNKDPLLDELKNIINIANWLKTKVNSPENVITKVADKVVEPTIEKAETEVEKIQENIFTEHLTAHLINSNLLLESENESKWKKWLMNIVKIILNPVMGGIGVIGSWAGSKILTLVAKFVEKLGGPKAVEYHVTPEIISAALEVSGAYEGAWNWVEEKIKEYAKYIPFAGELIELWHFGHKILFGYAVFEIIKEIAEGLGSAGKNLIGKTEVKEFLSPEFIRMKKLAGL
jgi:hypothetical protein